jgi:hypothetical protein
VQSSKNHFALGHMCGSVTVRGGCISSNMGVYVPALALKSPHTMVVSWGWALSIMSSIRVVAWASVMFLLFRDWDGGRYMLMILARWLFGSVILTK